MHLPGKIIFGLLLVPVLLAIVIFVSIHFTRQGKNESVSTEPPLNTTVSSTTSTARSTMSSILTSLSTSTTTSISINPTTTVSMTTSANMINSTSARPMTTTPVNMFNNTPTGAMTGSPINMLNNTLTRPMTTTPVNMFNNTPTGAMTTTLVNMPNSTPTGAMTTTPFNMFNSTLTRLMTTTAVNIMNSTSSAITTTTAVTTTSSHVCSFGFQPMVSYTTDDFIGPMVVDAGDFNNDNYIDIVVANYDGQSVGILLGNGDGTFSPEKITYIGNNTDPVAMDVGDFNNDHLLDTVVLSLDNANMVVLLGIGDGTFRVQKSVSTGGSSYPSGVVVGYLDKDNLLDLAIANSGNDRILVYTGYGNGTFRSQRNLQPGGGSEPNAVVIGDLNKDNNTDLVTANYGTNKAGVFLGYGNGSFRSQMTFTTGAGPSWIDVADFNGDNILDVAVLNMDANTIGVLLGIGNGTLGTQTTYSISNSSSTFFFTIADVNNDGQKDIVIPNSAVDTIGILLGRGDGTFQTQITVFTGSDSWPSALVVADFNRDNIADIAVANYDSNEVGVFLGTC